MPINTMRLRRATVAVPVEGPRGDEVETVDLFGLSALDIASLARANLPLLTGLWTLWIAGEMPPEHLLDVAMEEGPLLLAHVVALGAKSPGAVEDVAEWPAALQVEAAEKVLRLTVEGDGGLKKLVEIAGKLMGMQAPQNSPTS